MLALKITNRKDFMSKLLKGTTFEAFWLSEAVITTSHTFTIDGSIQYDFFDKDIASLLHEEGQTHSDWKDFQDYCFSIIRGNRTPLHFKIILQQPRKGLEKIIQKSGCMLHSNDVNGLFLNITYREDEILCTTGVSLRIFTMDKTIETTWDTLILHYFQKNNISFEQL